jgi:GPH family glycoside/pentoside/hexuronide:cation symporter
VSITSNKRPKSVHSEARPRQVAIGPGDSLGYVLFFAALWGLGSGGANHLLRALLADSYQYDELLTGERREGEFGVFIDFLGEKLPAIPGEVIPLMLMSSLGYVANQRQNSDVVWLLRLCFSIIPAAFSLLALPALLFLYPKKARDSGKFMAEVTAEMQKQRRGEPARDPLSGRLIVPPRVLQFRLAPERLAAAAGSHGP